MEVNTWCSSAFRQVRASLGNCQVAIMSLGRDHRRHNKQMRCEFDLSRNRPLASAECTRKARMVAHRSRSTSGLPEALAQRGTSSL
jgi:hypothetical protein